MINDQNIIDLTNAAALAGYNINPVELTLLTWNAGFDTHVPIALPVGHSAVYIFKHQENYLKVGQAGINSAARYLSHHYYTSAPSTLARSLQMDNFYINLINGANFRTWIRQNTTRYNILIPEQHGIHFVNFAEAYFILHCNPRFER